MIIIGIDPGPRISAVVSWDGNFIISRAMVPNDDLMMDLRKSTEDALYILAIEGLQSYGKIVGKDIFQTAMTIGRILEAGKIPVDRQEEHLIYRPAIKAHLCGTVRARDKNIRQALIDKLGIEVTKGVTSHLWSALAVCIVYYEIYIKKENLKKRKIS